MFCVIIYSMKTGGREKELTSAVDKLQQLFPELCFETFGGIVPVQAEGKIGVKDFYFRYRYDTASLTVGVKKAGAYLPTSEMEVEVETYSGDGLNGFLNGEEFVDVFTQLMVKFYKTKTSLTGHESKG